MARTKSVKLVVPFDKADGDMVFEFTEDLEITDSTEKSFALGPRGTLIRDAVDEIGDFGGVDLEPRRPLFLDLGNGQRQWRIEFERGEAADGPFGDGSTDPLFDADATERGTIAAGEVLMKAASRSQTDSRNPSKLHIGEYGDSGPEDPFLVSIQSASVSVSGDDPARFEGSITVQETARYSLGGLGNAIPGY